MSKRDYVLKGKEMHIISYSVRHTSLDDNPISFEIYASSAFMMSSKCVCIGEWEHGSFKEAAGANVTGLLGVSTCMDALSGSDTSESGASDLERTNVTLFFMSSYSIIWAGADFRFDDSEMKY